MKLNTPIFAPDGDGSGTGGGTIFSAAPGAPAAPAGTPPGAPAAPAAPAGQPGAPAAPAGSAAPGAPASPGQGGNGAFSFATVTDEQGAFKPGWTESLPDELKPTAETLKRYKTPVELMRGLHQANVLLGSKANAVVVPNEQSKPEEVAAFRKALGVPDKPEDYGVKKPEKLPEGVTWNEPRTNDYLGVLHKHNASPALVRELLGMQMVDQEALVKMQGENEGAFVQQSLAQLQKDWGVDFMKNVKSAEAVVNHYAERTGISVNHPAMAFPEVLKFIASIHADYMSEGKRIEGGGITGNDPAVEAKRIQTDEQHPMHKRYQNGEPTAVEHVRGLLKRAEDARK